MNQRPSLTVQITQSPRVRRSVGGVVLKFISLNSAGNEESSEEILPMKKGLRNNAVAILGAIGAVKYIERHHAELDEGVIRVLMDSGFVSENIASAMFRWPKRRWQDSLGRQVPYSDLWKELILRMARVRIRIEFRLRKDEA
jgi:ribonuclease HI